MSLFEVPLAMHSAGCCSTSPPRPWTPGSRTEVNEVIRELAQAGLTMVVVPHDLQFAGRISDNIVFMDKQGHSGVRAAGPDSVQPAESPVQRSL